MKNELTHTRSGTVRFRRVTKLGKGLPFTCILVAGIMLLGAVCLLAQESAPVAGQIGNAISDQAVPLNPPPQESASLFFAILKVVGSLVLVIGIMLLVIVLIKKLGLTGPTMRSGSLINILETRMLAPKKHIAVLEIAKQYLVIGITDHQISLIARLDNNDALAGVNKQDIQATALSETPFAALIKKAMQAASGKGTKETKDLKA